jgi:hypothetical protein
MPQPPKFVLLCLLPLFNLKLAPPAETAPEPAPPA